MRIQTRLEKLEKQKQGQDVKVITGTKAEIERYESMDDESFYKETGIDRAACDLLIFVLKFVEPC